MKHQEALERRRVRSLRDKREAEEAVKAKIRRAVTARMRGKLGGAAGGDSGLEGGGDGGAEQVGTMCVKTSSIESNFVCCGVLWDVVLV